jgi:hypothetical protein
MVAMIDFKPLKHVTGVAMQHNPLLEQGQRDRNIGVEFPERSEQRARHKPESGAVFCRSPEHVFGFGDREGFIFRNRGSRSKL